MHAAMINFLTSLLLMSKFIMAIESIEIDDYSWLQVDFHVRTLVFRNPQVNVLDLRTRGACFGHQRHIHTPSGACAVGLTRDTGR